MKERSKLLASIGRESLLDVIPGLDRAILDSGEIRVFTPGERVVQEGSEPTHYIMPLSASLRLLTLAAGQERFIGYLQKHRSLGLKEILKNEKYSYSAEAESVTNVLFLPRDIFDKSLAETPQAIQYLKLITESSGLRSFRTALVDEGATADVLFQIFSVIDLQPIIVKAGSAINLADPALFFVKKGTLKVTTTTKTNKQMESQISEGAWFGGRALVPPNKYDYEVFAMTDVILHRAPLSKINRLLAAKNFVDLAYSEPWLSWEGDVEDDELLGGSLCELPGEVISWSELSKLGVGFNPSYMKSANSDAESGVAALANICLIKQIDANYANLRQDVLLGGKTTLLELGKALEKYGVVTQGISSSIEKITRIRMPVITSLGTRTVILMSVQGKNVFILDPARGLVKLDRDSFSKHWCKQILDIQKIDLNLDLQEQDQKDPVKKENEVRKRLRSFFRGLVGQEFNLLTSIFFLSIITFCFELLIPQFSQAILDEVLTLKDTKMLQVYTVGLFITIMLNVGVTVIRQFAVGEFSAIYDFQLSRLFYRQALNLKVGFFAKSKIGEIFGRISEIMQIRQFLSGSSIKSIIDLIAVVVYTIVLFFYSWKVALVGLALLPLSLLIQYFYQDKLKINYNRQFENDSKMNSLLSEQISSIATIKAAGAEEKMRHRWEEAFLKGVQSRRENQLFGSAIQGLLAFLSSTVRLGGLWAAGTLAVQGEMSAGEILGVSMYLDKMINPISSLSNLFLEYQQVKVAFDKLGDVFESDPEETAKSATTTQSLRLGGKIKLDRVGFRYEEKGDWILNEINLTIYPGQVVAIVGRSGCGKTTLAKMIAGNLKPTTGRLYFDSFDSTFLSLESLRRQVGFIMQSNDLFAGSIGDNIAYGDDAPSIEKVEQAATEAAAIGFISQFPTGFKQYLSEGGMGLSGGQRQRVSIARSLYRIPKILIMDEATSALDAESEKAIVENMKEILRGKTAIVIAHRLSTIRDADRIIVMKDGKVVEEGKHEELLRRGGHYSELFAGQASAGGA